LSAGELEALRARVAELEAEVARCTDVAEARTRELDAFSYAVSHDLRSPLRVIDGFSKALAEDYGDAIGDEGKRFIEHIGSGVERMTRYVDALLDLARIARADVAVEDVDLSETARGIAQNVATARPEHVVTLAVEEGLRVRADRALLVRALTCLLDNAWKFTSTSDGARVEVGRDELTPNGFFVRDNGVGFDMAHADRLFAPFQRLHAPKDFPGAGIGLAVAQRVVVRHGGKIEAKAEPNAGATFLVSLPLR
jgi:light-regulated signal transduction histidine kinase (bacteriophytochrome)